MFFFLSLFAFYCYFHVNEIITPILFDNPTFFTQQRMWPAIFVHQSSFSHLNQWLGDGGLSLNPDPLTSCVPAICW